MSLDVMHCKIVKPTEANAVYKLDDNPRLKALQPTGLIVVHEFRVGRNCLNRNWHRNYELKTDYDKYPHYDLDEIRVIFPDEVDAKLLKHLCRLNPKEGVWLEKDKLKDFDFIYISW